MRLTLRTLLAYIDNMLEPADREELEKRIETSEFANELIHMTRDTMRLLRLGAPALKGDGMGFDPNTVAEYLDSTLPPEHVAEFEKVCLDSKEHLAEVASCHHVLTMILGEPADIDPDLRRRMYAIPQQAPPVRNDQNGRHLRNDLAHPEMVTSLAPPSPPTPQPLAARMEPVVSPPSTVRRVEIPDYLLASEPSKIRKVLPALAALLLLGVTAFVAFVNPGFLRNKPDSLTAANSASTEGTSSALTEPAEAVAVESTPSPAETPTVEPEQPPAVKSEANTNETSTAAVEEPSTPPAMVQEPVLEAPAETPPLAAETTPPVPTGETSTSTVPTPVVPPQDDAPIASASQPDLASVALPLVPPINRSAVAPPATSPEEMSAATESTEPGITEPAGEPPAPAPPANLGTYASVRDILLVSGADEIWNRVAPRAQLPASAELLALPTYRPSISLESGLNMDLVGGTRIQCEAVSGTSPTKIKIQYGRIVLVNTSGKEVSAALQIGANESEVVFSPAAVLAVDVNRSFEPGLDPAVTPSSVLARLVSTTGKVKWKGQDATMDVATPSMWEVNDMATSPTVPYDNSATWVDGLSLASWEQISSPAIEKMITTDQPVSFQLLGLYNETKRKEEKALLTESSMHVGQFMPFVKSLNDSNQQTEWDDQIVALRSAMARSPELAKEVQQTLVDQRGADKAKDLYKLLVGFSAQEVGRTGEEMEAGALRQLIDWLESDQLDYRALAYYNLKTITGKPLYYNPTGLLKSRNQGVAIWRKRLKDHDLIPASAL